MSSTAQVPVTRLLRLAAASLRPRAAIALALPLSLAFSSGAANAVGPPIDYSVEIQTLKSCPPLHPDELLEDIKVEVRVTNTMVNNAGFTVAPGRTSAVTGDGGFGDAVGVCTAEGDTTTERIPIPGDPRPTALLNAKSWEVWTWIRTPAECPQAPPLTYAPNPRYKRATVTKVSQPVGTVIVEAKVTLKCVCAQMLPAAYWDDLGNRNEDATGIPSDGLFPSNGGRGTGDPSSRGDEQSMVPHTPLRDAAAMGDVDYYVAGTGTTTGVTLGLSNNTDEFISISVPTGTPLVPPDGAGSQPYVFGPNEPIALEPDDFVTTSMNAFCTDAARPPAAPGEPAGAIGAVGDDNTVGELLAVSREMYSGEEPPGGAGPFERSDPEAFQKATSLYTVWSVTGGGGKAKLGQTIAEQLRHKNRGATEKSVRDLAERYADEIEAAVEAVRRRHGELRENGADFSEMDPTLESVY